ncbi:MAG: 3-dehydroquinate synthase family protein [Acidobacteriota bacterium]
MGNVERLSLRHAGGVTSVLVGHEMLPAARPIMSDWLQGKPVFVVTDPKVWGLHGETLQKGLLDLADRVILMEVEEGEAAKTLATAERLWQRMLAEGGKRDSRLLTFGGGSIGDLGGFVAGCFLRGIECAHVPTTLLAQVDAALGGKTAVDVGGLKNTVGLFHHPQLVLSDISFLSTLPGEEIRAALGEVVKMALLLDRMLLERVEGRLEKLLAADPDALLPVVLASARAKLKVVEKDPREGDQRRLLNFGHTLGHAIEAAQGLAGSPLDSDAPFGELDEVEGAEPLRHGEAVIYGMLFALRLAVRRGLDAGVALRFHQLLRRFPVPKLPPLSQDELLAAMGMDKKAREEGLTWVLPLGLEKGRMVDDVTADELRETLQDFLADPWAVAWDVESD